MDPAFGPQRPASVRTEGLSRAFDEVFVVRDAAMGLDEAAVVSLIGANGSGKTTFLRIVAGVLAPSAGTVSVCGRAPGQGLASYVAPGDRMLNWRLTGRQNLEFFARIAGRRRAFVPAAVRDAAAMLDAVDLLDKHVGECSTGQRRRLMLATGFVSCAPVILLDEPYADLDRDGRDAVAAAARHWADAGGIVMYAAPVEEDGPPADVVFGLRAGSVERVR